MGDEGEALLNTSTDIMRGCWQQIGFKIMMKLSTHLIKNWSFDPQMGNVRPKRSGRSNVIRGYFCDGLQNLIRDGNRWHYWSHINPEHSRGDLREALRYPRF